jgi:twitching motility two-component system response regulator PilG
LIKKKILVVEDENCLLKLVCILLTSKGYDVMGAVNGEEALEKISHFKPDLVLLDVIMPGIDGFEVCRRIKSDPKTEHIPVVMLTAKRKPQDIRKGEEAGAVSYITKPFKSFTVIETIQKYLQDKMDIA